MRESLTAGQLRDLDQLKEILSDREISNLKPEEISIWREYQDKLNNPDNDGILSYIATKGDELMLNNFLSKRPTNIADWRDLLLRNMLHIAIMNNNEKIVGALLDRGINIERTASYDIQSPFQTGVFDKTPLHFATRYNRKEILKELINRGADIFKVDAYGNNPFDIAISYGNEDCCHILIESGMSVNYRSNQGSALDKLIIHKADISILKKLVELGIDINQADNRGETALHKAAFCGNVEATKFLLENDADINALNRGNRSAWDIARERSNIEILEVLSHRDENLRASYLEIISNLSALDVEAVINTKNVKLKEEVLDFANNRYHLVNILKNHIKKGDGYIQDSQEQWDIVESIVKDIPMKHKIEVVASVVRKLDNTNRRERLINMLPEGTRNQARAMVDPTLWEAVHETSELMHGNSSAEAPERKFKKTKSTSINI